MNSINLYAAVQAIAVAFVPIMLGMILHEVAHGFVAYKMGDPTAKMLGRLSLNPIPHIDPMGTACFVLTAIASSAAGTGFVIGWAKPVPINPRYFRNFKQGMVLVSLAGAVTNLILAFLFAVLLSVIIRFGNIMPDQLITNNSFIIRMCQSGILINCILAWFNLMPIPPLDGSKVLACILPQRLAAQYMSLERYGMIIVILLLASGIMGRIIWPFIQFTVEFFEMIIF